MRLPSYENRIARWRCACMVALCMAFLLCTQQAMAAENEPLEEALEQWRAGQVVGPIEVTVDPTWYDPALGGINCNGDCEHLGPSAYGVKAADNYFEAAACPSEVPYGSTLTFTTYHGEYIEVKCLDGGDSIVFEDGIMDVDLQRPYDVGVWRMLYPGLLTFPELPKPEVTGGGPRYAPICLDSACLAPVIAPDTPTPPPFFVCPASTCDGTLVKGMTDGHFGVDWRTWSVYAPAAGQVIKAKESYDGCGGSVVLDLGGGWWSRLCHFERMFVEAGQTVRAGQLLGFAGRSGSGDGEHVHVETYWAWTPHDLEALLSEEQPG